MITRRLTTSALLVSALALAACGGTPVKLGADGKPLPRVYKIAAGQESVIQYRFLDAVNALRQARGAAPMVLDAQLTAAAATHARDMAVQNRPWHFGSDGSSPVERVRRTGYPGIAQGENISESYETELETLSAWMEDANTARVVTDPNARAVGLSWYQEPNGKIWWTMVTGN
ncbi:CAP domain-containing protein [Frigidibacter sp. MR17.14]|uniref:CAP domain-containing protein n=1 Tax=Frigidibacter sp. MR17.14 TaxID=3126509 RepID=UPI003012E772